MTETLRDGRFIVLGTLGEGSQGRTFDGVDKREGQSVAIKQFDVRGARSWKDVELAEREARVLKSLTHPKLPRYVDHFEEDGSLYLVMEKIEGESLGSIRTRGATLSEYEVLRLLRDASDVLDYLHGRAPPVFHRDLKPGNVLRRPDGSFAFVDFGAVRDKLRVAGGSTVVGTFGYMAPEQFQGRALPGTDVYAIGATAISMLTGQEPEDLPHRGLGIDVRAALRGHASASLTSVLERMVEPDPDRRASRLSQIISSVETPRAHTKRARTSRPVEPRNDGPHQPRMNDSFRSAAEHSSRRGRNRAKHDARREERAVRRARRFEQRRNGHGPPWPLTFLLSLVLSLGILLVALTSQVVVPLLLQFLSVIFARQSFQHAAHRTRMAGRDAIESMNRSRRWLNGEAHSPAAAEEREPTRVAADAPRVRVDDVTASRERYEKDDEQIDEHAPPTRSSNDR